MSGYDDAYKAGFAAGKLGERERCIKVMEVFRDSILALKYYRLALELGVMAERDRCADKLDALAESPDIRGALSVASVLRNAAAAIRKGE